GGAGRGAAGPPVATPAADGLGSVIAGGGLAPRAIGRSGMNVLGRRKSVASVVVAVTCILSTALWAGGAGFGDDDDNSEEEGPSYFGFVKDTNGATVPDAKATVGVKNRGSVVTRTGAIAGYKVPG